MWVRGALLLLAAAGAAGGAAGGGYGFYRELGAGGGASGGGESARRVFGGAATELAEFPRAVALLDRYWAARCSGAALAPHWVLTAAHCVTPRLAYVKYNTRRPASPAGDHAAVLYLYRHPGFEVVQQRGADADVTLLHHDVGLVRTRDALRLRAPPPPTPHAALRRYDALELAARDEQVSVRVLGFGRTERSVLGEELFGARLTLVRCARAAWLHCACGAAGGGGGGGGGVCSGDSGGPVLYRGEQVGVTSMGPVQCARGGGGAVAADATSVFTSLYQYADVVNATVADAEAALRMARVASAAPPPLPPPPPPLLLLLLLPPVRW